MGNHLKTAVLLAALTIFIMLIGQLLGGRQGLVIALILATAMNFFSYWFSDKIVLSIYRAKPVSLQEAPQLYRSVEKLSASAGLPMPKLYLLAQDTPNAFATGRNPERAVVAVTRGLLSLLEADEIEGVLAHELAHVKNRDILIGSIAATMAGAIMMLANMARWAAIFGAGGRDEDDGAMGGFGLIIMSILAPIGAMLIQMAISRSREYLADSTGARFAGNSEGLARALEKLETYNSRMQMTATPATAHMFIVNPLSGRGVAHLFSTHPPLRERIRRLRGQPPIQFSENRNVKTMSDQGTDFWNRLK